jgi:hypothetical protein
MISLRSLRSATIQIRPSSGIALAVIPLLASGCIFPTDDDLDVSTDTTTSGAPSDDAADGADDTDGEPLPEPFQHRFFVMQHLEYDGLDAIGVEAHDVPEQCQGLDIYDDLVADLVPEFSADGWQGVYARDRERYPEAEVHGKPEMFAESYADSPFGATFADPSDAEHADAYDLALYVGNGHHGLLATNRPADDDSSNECNVQFEPDIRLGAFCGQTTKLAIYSSPCALGFDHVECPRPPEDGDYDAFAPWPWECWDPFICTTLQSSVGHTMAFKDVPVIGAGQHANWYGNAKSMVLSYSWLSAMVTEDLSGSANQPSILVVGDDYDDMNQRIYQADIETGVGLAKMGPDFTEITGIGLIYLTWDGQTGLLQDDGTPLQYGTQDPETNPNCLPDIGIACEGLNPDGASFGDCVQ